MLCFSLNCGNIIEHNYSNAREELNINARSAYLIDAHTGTVVYSKNENEKLPVASMTKLATLSVIFNEINKGSLSLSEQVTVSQNAADTEGSSAFLDAESKYTVADLIKTIVVVSANDSCVALAEHISGTEQLFVNKMNSLAQSLALKNTHFENSTGLPSDNHYSSAKDMAKIYQTIYNNAEYKKYSKIWMEDFIHPGGRITGLVNTNRLIKTYDGCESGKTGHTQEAKYCLTASASRGGTKLISVIIGATDSKSRFEQTKQMFNYGFANYESKIIVDKQVPVGDIEITGASIKKVPVYASQDYIAFCKKGEQTTYKTHLVAFNKVQAPLNMGDKVGTLLILDQNNIVITELDLVVNQPIEKIKLGQIFDNIFKSW